MCARGEADRADKGGGGKRGDPGDDHPSGDLPADLAPFLPTPVPRIEPVATWVVDSGIPATLEVRMIEAELASAEKPWGGAISTKPLPSGG